jgi:hypothetical protein
MRQQRALITPARSSSPPPAPSTDPCESLRICEYPRQQPQQFDSGLVDSKST